MMTHNSKTCDLCLVGREDLCIIREKSISDFDKMITRNGNFKDFDTLKKERKLYELKLAKIEKKSPA